jgi:hypothetical protein
MRADDRVQAFAVVAHKSFQKSGADVLAAAWTPLLQRLERTSYYAGSEPVIIVHDEGENPEIRRLARWSRRRLSAGSITGAGSVRNPFVGLVDDPFPKASHESYFLQLADIVAYAAFRRLYPPGAAISSVVPQNSWDELGRAIRTEVTSQRVRTTPGIVEVQA